MKSNKLLGFLLFLVLLESVYAQSEKQAYKFYTEKKYEKAFLEFQKCSKQSGNKAICYFYLSNIFLTQSNFDSAFVYVTMAENEYNKQNILKPIDDEYKISEISLKKLKELILLEAYNKATISQDIDTLRNFSKKYNNTPYAKSADSIANALKITRDTYWYYTQDGEVASFNYFLKKFSDYVEYDKFYFDKALAEKGAKLLYSNSSSISSEYDSYISQAAPRELAFVALQQLIRQDIKMQNWNSAKLTVEKYIPYFKDHAKKLKDLLKILQKEDKELNVNTFPDSVNSTFSEYLPVLTADGNTLYFCTNNRPEHLGWEDIYVSNKIDETMWSMPKLIPYLNTADYSEAVSATSVDGNTLILFINGNICFANRTLTSWSEPIPIDKNSPKAGINTKSWESDAKITADGRALFFVSDRKENIGSFHPKDEKFHGTRNGNTDIWVSLRKDNKWTEPINLGETINTPYADRTPFLHPDMKTLYFSSDGHGGLGGFDVYKSTRLSDTCWTCWCEPVNLGKEINTADDDLTYVITTDGKYALYAAQSGENFDIFNVTLPEEFRPKPVATIKGKVLDNLNLPKSVTIHWEDLNTGEIIGEAKTNPVDGSYFITLPMDKNYGYFIEGDDFFPISGNINLQNKDTIVQVAKDFRVATIDFMKKSEEAIVLNNLFFETSKSDLKPESYPELNRLLQFLKNKPNQKIEILGHTDSKGKFENNQMLSEARAKSVRDYLISKGINAENILATGYGQNMPIADNSTDEGRAKNRRVEMKLK